MNPDISTFGLLLFIFSYLKSIYKHKDKLICNIQDISLKQSVHYGK